VFPLIGAALAIFLMKYLERDTWIRFVGWLLIGLVVYFAYGIRHSKLRQGVVENPEAKSLARSATAAACRAGGDYEPRRGVGARGVARRAAATSRWSSPAEQRA
jgi:APA family basic amino acid/polyamine antiporter